MSYKISAPNHPINCMISLDGSKSISNRVLIIRALCDENFNIKNLSNSDDTQTLVKLLQQQGGDLDTGHAGTTFRFLTAYLSLQDGEQVLTGSARMKQRPIGPLVDALNTLGANIKYLENNGYPPLSIGQLDMTQKAVLEIDGSMSSQYISALLLIAPKLRHGLNLKINGDLVSRPYIEMTLRIMSYFGISSTWYRNTIQVNPGKYIPRKFTVEADWSAASYFYSIVALSDDTNINLIGLQENSLQGDAAMKNIGLKLGVSSVFEDGLLKLKKLESFEKSIMDYDFIQQPDLAQTVAVACAGLGMEGVYSGLQTLKIKETDRISALQNELSKFGVSLTKFPSKFSSKSNKEYYYQHGQAKTSETPSIATYHDHRMAMAFAPLALISPIIVQDPSVVTKSYPKFWEDLKKLGFKIELI